MSNHLTDAQYAAFIDRLIACRQAEDDAKEDTKQVYAELADAGEDKTAAGLIVRGLRMSAKDRAKANLRDAAVEKGFDRYNRGKASHVRAREASIPEHDADGVITEPDVAMRPQTVASRDAGPVNADAGQATVESPATHSEPVTTPTAASSPAEVTEAGDRSATDPNAAPVVADQSKPNPICRDPDDCGVYASWAMPCEACKRAAAHRSAA